MSFEETSGYVSIDNARDLIDENIKSLLNRGCLRTLLDSFIEERLDVGEGVLVHWVDTRQISDDEVQDTSSDGDNSVQISRVIDLHLNHL